LKTKKYILDPKVTLSKKLTFKILRIIFHNELKYFSDKDFIRIGKNQIFLNLIFKKFLRHNTQAKFMIHFTSRVVLPDAIRVIDNCSKVYSSFAVSNGSYYQAYNGITFETGSMFGPGVKFISSNHRSDNLSIHEDERPIHVGKNCWIGAGAIILPGVNLGDGSIIGAGSVITKPVEPYTVVVGNPARIVRRLN